MNKNEVEKLQKMYKTDIHCHLDGSLYPSTMKYIAIKDNIDIEIKNSENKIKDIKTTKIEEIKEFMEVGENTKDLIEYLEKFSITTKLMQTKENLELISYQLIEQMKKDNVIYSEIRFAPHLHLLKGLTQSEVVESVLNGIKMGEKKFKIKSNLILCILRNFEVKMGDDILELAKKYKNKGVVAIDIAGDEFNYPVEMYKEVLGKAKKSNINITVHAGEGRGSESVENSISLGAQRIGHGIRSFEDKNLLKKIGKSDISFEISFKSNIGTKLLKNFKLFPLKEFLQNGIKCNINTDNRLISGTTISNEIEVINKYLGKENNEDESKILSINDFMLMFENGISVSFLKKYEKEKLLNKIKKHNNKILNYNEKEIEFISTSL